MNFDGYDNQVSSNALTAPGKKNKQKNAKLKNPAIKEATPLIKYGSTILVIGAAAYYLIFMDDSLYSYSKFRTQRAQIENSVSQLTTSASQVGTATSKVTFLNQQIAAEQAMLQEANLVRSPLTENYSFFGYFDDLVTKYKINVESISVRNGKTPANGQANGQTNAQKPAQNVAIQQAQQVTDGLSPIDIKVTSKYSDAVEMFKSLYVRRAIYIKDLSMVNLLDGYVETTFTVTFREESNANGQAPKTQQATGTTQGQQSTGNQQAATATGTQQQKPAATGGTVGGTTPTTVSSGSGSGNVSGNVTVSAPQGQTGTSVQSGGAQRTGTNAGQNQQVPSSQQQTQQPAGTK